MYLNTFALIITSGLYNVHYKFTINILGIGFIASFSALPVVVGFAAGCSWVVGASIIKLKYVFTVEEGGAEFVENMEICIFK